MIPGEYHVKPGQIALNTGRATCRVVVENHGDRPIQVGSALPFRRGQPGAEVRPSAGHWLSSEYPGRHGGTF